MSWAFLICNSWVSHQSQHVHVVDIGITTSQHLHGQSLFDASRRRSSDGSVSLQRLLGLNSRQEGEGSGSGNSHEGRNLHYCKINRNQKLMKE